MTLLALACCMPARLPAASQEFTFDSWSIEDGLPQSSVLSIAQTPDGYLWLATFGGLARFDGVRFTVFDTSNLPGLPDSRIILVHVDRAGALWLTTEAHELVRVADGTCRAFGPEDGLPPDGVFWVRDDGQGGLWVAGLRTGLWQERDGVFTPVPAPPRIGEWPVHNVRVQHDGRIWFTHGGSLHTFHAGRLTEIPAPAGEPNMNVKQLCPSRDGGLWVLTSQSLRKYRDGAWLPEVWPSPAFQTHITGSREDAAGSLWLATYRDGLFRFTPAKGWQHYTTDSGLTTPSLRSLFCDREGNLWAGTDGGGLIRIKPRPWQMITRREGLGIDAVHSITEDLQGRIWLAGGTGRPYWLDEGTVSAPSDPPLSDVGKSVWAVLAARDGTIWIGTYDTDAEVLRYHDGTLTRYGRAQGMLAGSVRALFEDSRGTIWIGGFNGLGKIEQDGQVTHYGEQEGLSSERVWALAEGAPGCLYVGTSGGGLNVLRDGKFTAYTRQDGLPDDNVRALYADREGALWIGTRAGGLSRFRDGHFFSFRIDAGLPARSVGPMLEDARGFLWMITNLGILRTSRRELNEFAAGARRDVSYVLYDRGDGLATIEAGGVQPACLEARDGILWFGTTKGAALVDPRELRPHAVPPPVIIEEVRIDDEVVRQRSAATSDPNCDDARGAAPAHLRAPASQPVTLSPHQRRVEFRFTGPSFAAPERVRFRYRMEGFDPDWIDGGTARSATYTRLTPGRYRFHVTARNNDGVWNETGAALRLIVVPAFHQTWWFDLLVLAGVAGAVAAGYGLRVARLKQLARLRERIAGDLHDEIGSNLGGIILLSDLAKGTPALPPDARASIEEIGTTAQRTASAMRDIVWFLNPDFDTFDDMIARIRETAATLLSGIECRFEVPQLAPARRLPLEFRRNVFFAFKEMLHNIVKHAGATRVEIRIEHAGRMFTLEVCDNGRGFDPDGASSGHGLRSLRQRAASLGGQVTIESAPGKGSRVTLTAPLP